jgi:hemolysin activation/secretion protein
MVLSRAQESLLQEGFVTTRVLAQPQDVSRGTLAITVVPGLVNAIRFKDAHGPHPSALNSVPARPGEILNLRAVEQALENLKRVPTANADILIEPAQALDAANQSDLVISWQQSAPARFSLTADDSGSKGTGKYQGSATLSLDNPLDLSDLLYLTENHELGGGDVGARGTRGYVLHYSLPLGYWTLGSTYSSSRYFQSVAGRNQEYIYRGTSESTEFKLSRLVQRDAQHKISLGLKGWQRKSNNFIDDTEVQVQRRVVGGWEIDLSHRAALGASEMEGRVIYRRGTNDFDSIPAPEEAFHEGTSRLGLLTLDFSVNVPFQFWGGSFGYNPALHIQDNTTPLTPQDRFAIGGRYSVRGFNGESSLVGERGWTLRNDWSLVLGASAQEAYLGIDAGEVGGPSSQILKGNTLAGGVVGLRGSFTAGRANFRYDLFLGAPIAQPSGFKTAETVGGFTLTCQW